MHFINKLVEPHPSVQAPEQRRRLKTLNLLSLILVVLVGFSGLQLVYENNQSIYQGIVALHLINLTATVIITHSPYYRWAIRVIAIGSIFISLVGTAIVGLPALQYLIPSYVMASLFMTRRQAVAMTLAITIASYTILYSYPWGPVNPDETVRAIVIGIVIVNILHSIFQDDIQNIRRQMHGHQQTEAYYRLLAENITDFVTLQDAEARFIYLSPSYTKTLGYTLDELHHRLACEYVHPDDLEAVQQTFYQIITTKQPIRQREYRMRKNSGEYFWVESHVSPILDADGHVQQILTSTRDITERKRIQDELLASQTRLKEAQEIARLAYWKIDWATGSVEWSDEHYHLFGIPVGTPLTFEAYNALLHPEDRERVLTEFQQYLAEKVTGYRQSYRVILSNQQTRYVTIRTRITYGPDGEPQTIAGTLRDITEQYQLRAARQRSDAEAQALLDAIPDLVFEINKAGIVINFKADARELYTHPNAIIGKSVGDLLPPTVADRTLTAIQAALESGQIQTYDYDLFLSQSGRQFYEARLVPRDSNRVVALIRNITERVNTERLLVQQNEYLAILYQVTLQLLNRQHQSDLFQIIVDEASAILDAPYGELMLLDGDDLVVEAFTPNQPFLLGDKAKRGEAKVSWQAFDTKTPVVIDNYSALPNRRPLYEANTVKLGAVASFPILTGDNTCVGVLELSRHLPSAPFTSAQIRLGELFSQLVAVVLDNARLYALAVQELNQRTLMQAALHVSEKRFRSIFEESPIGIALMSLEGHWLQINPAIDTILGYSPDELLFTDFHDITHPDDMALGGPEMAALLHGERKTFRLQKRYIHKDGHVVWVLLTLSLLKDEKGMPQHFLAQLIDISEIKRLEESLRLLERAVSYSAWGIAIADARQPDLPIVYINDAVEAITGYGREDFIGKSMRVLQASDRNQPALDEIRVALKTAESRTVILRNYRKDGTLFWNELHLSPVFDEDRVLTHFVGTLMDISSRVAANEEQTRLLNKIEAVNRDLNDFAYIVSHDLKAPLRGIGSIASWLLTDYSHHLDAEGQDLLNLLSNRVRRADTLIAALLDYSRIGRVAEQRIRIDLLELLDSAIGLLVPKKTFEVHLDWQVLAIEGDPVRFQQVFQNLIGNAVKYMDKPHGVLTLSAKEQDEYYHFCVGDNGPGIEPRFFERIFQIFQTLQPRDQQESTGIGLTIVKRIIENYGGRIWVESTLGSGSEFHFVIPKEGGDG